MSLWQSLIRPQTSLALTSGSGESRATVFVLGHPGREDPTFMVMSSVIQSSLMQIGSNYNPLLTLTCVATRTHGATAPIAVLPSSRGREQVSAPQVTPCIVPPLIAGTVYRLLALAAGGIPPALNNLQVRASNRAGSSRST